MDAREQQRAKLRICLTHLTAIAANRTGKLYRISPKERQQFSIETQEVLSKEINILLDSLIPVQTRAEIKNEVIPILTI